MADDKRKKRGRSKILGSCFRSFPANEGPSSSYRIDSRNTKNGLLGKPVLIAVSDSKREDFVPDGNLVKGGVADSGVDCYAKRRSSRRRISRILKAVLFDSMMAKKTRRSSSKSSIASDTNAASNDSTACRKECIDMDDYCSRSNLLSSSSRTTASSCSVSSSSSSSVNSNSRWSSNQKASSRIDSVDFKPLVSSNSSILKKRNPINSSSRSCFDQKVSAGIDSLHRRRQDSISESSSCQIGLSRLDLRNSDSSNSSSLTKPNPNKIKSGGNNWNIGWCLFLLLSLVVLMIWGRIFSILCTSIGFYIVHCRRIKRVNSVTNTATFLDIDSVQYRKNVIMAGLLERTRYPVR